MVDLGSVAGGEASAVDVNAAGTVIGWSNSRSGYEVGFVWTPRTGTRVLDFGYGATRPVAVNNFGVVVGTGWIRSGSHAFRWTAHGGLQDLGTLGGLTSEAYGINDHGSIVGQADGTSGQRAFIWTPRRGMRAIPGDGYSIAVAISNSGWVTGFVWQPGPRFAAYRWSERTGVQLLPPITSGRAEDIGLSVNNRGQVAGCALADDGYPHATLWS